jgi:hypothetical protein
MTVNCYVMISKEMVRDYFKVLFMRTCWETEENHDNHSRSSRQLG